MYNVGVYRWYTHLSSYGKLLKIFKNSISPKSSNASVWKSSDTSSNARSWLVEKTNMEPRCNSLSISKHYVRSYMHMYDVFNALFDAICVHTCICIRTCNITFERCCRPNDGPSDQLTRWLTSASWTSAAPAWRTSGRAVALACLTSDDSWRGSFAWRRRRRSERK